MGYYFIIVSPNYHSLNMTSNFYLIIVPVDHKVLYMIPYPLRTIVLIDRVGILLLSRLGTLPWSVSSRLLGMALWNMIMCVSMGRGCSLASGLLMLLVMGLLLCTLWHILKCRISLLLLLLNDGIYIWDQPIQARNVWHSVHKEHVVVVAWVHTSL